MHAKLDGVRCTRLSSHVNVKVACKVPSRRCQACATNGSDPQPAKSQNAARGSGEHKPSIEGGGILGLAYESERTQGQIVKSQGLHRAPLSGGVKTATTRFDLPTPPVAVRNLVELARFGHLSTTMSNMHHRRAGYPFGTLVDFSVDGAGHPVFCLSPLAIHSRNLLEEPRASLVVQMPGWTGLANARVTIFGDVYPLAQEQQAAARDIFFAKHSSTGSKERWVSGNFVYFRMNRIVDIYFVGGFGTVQWITPADFLSSRPDDVVLDHPMRTLQMLSETFGPDLKALMAPDLGKPGQTIDELMFISIDANGVDVRLRVGAEFTVERINFGTRVTTAAGAVEAIKKVVSGEKEQQAQQAQQHK